MTARLDDFAAEVRCVARTVEELEPLAAEVGAAPAAGREWFELLHRKLLPQLDASPLLIVAVVGGTNIGKSVIFNHLAGETASAAIPLAAGTRHPVCLAPPDGVDESLLARLLAPFELRPWTGPDDALSNAPEDIVFWRVGRNVPSRLVLMDTPDVDSDVTVNWRRAQSVRQTADVLIAVLTQQKYNDAAVKEFFRLAVEADKPIIIVFNMCDLADDRDYWPLWLERFCSETGAKPELVYVAPYDRNRAGALDLPFHRLSDKSISDGSNGRDEVSKALEPLPATALRDELAAMHFEAIKLRTYRGAMRRVIDKHQGIPAWLNEIRAVSRKFAAAAAVLSATQMASVDWPSLPTNVLVDEIRDWWDGTRSNWSRNVHGFYRAVGRGAMWPIRKAIAVIGPNSFGSSGEDPLEAFRRRERTAVVGAVEKLLNELTRLSQVGNEILRPRLQKLIGGQARSELLERIENAHRLLPAVDEDYRAFLREQLDSWKADNIQVVRYLETLDHAMAVARPAITVGLFVSGWVFAGGVVGQAAAHAVGQTAGHLATEAAIVGGGEAIVGGAGEGVRHAAARLLLRLQSRYAERRAQWLAECLDHELLGGLLADLRRGAELPHNSAMQRIEASIDKLQDA